MQKMHSNLKKGELKLKVTNLDDLWVLSQIVDEGDLVKGVTVRKIKVGDSSERGSAISKRTVFISLKVEKIEFHEFESTLRISGKVVEAPEDIPRGSYHTFSVEENTVLTIIKEKWLSYQLERVHEALQELSHVMICVFDREEAFFALLKRHKYELLLELKGTVQKKDDPGKVASTFYRDIIEKLQEYDKRHQLTTIILASPAFWKEYLLKELHDETLRKKIRLATCSSATRNAIEEVLKSQELKSLLKEDRMAKESQLVESVMREISLENLAVYGFNETKQAVEQGAVKTLLVTDTLIKQKRQENNYHHLDKIMKGADATQAEVVLISGEHEAGQKLQGLGGIAGLLRYKLSY